VRWRTDTGYPANISDTPTGPYKILAGMEDVADLCRIKVEVNLQTLSAHPNL
jgi:hypothetical protein